MQRDARRVALFCPAGNEYIHRLVEGIVRYHRERGGFVLRDFRYPAPGFRPPEEAPLWEHWRPHGILSHVDAIPGMDRWLRQSGVPVVNTSIDYPHDVLPCVHGVGAGRLAAEHFLGLGVEHFAFVGYTESPGSARIREAFGHELARHGYSVRGFDIDILLDQGREDLESEAARDPRLVEFLVNAPKPLGLFARDDSYARCVCSLLRRLKIAVPDEVAVLGLEDTLIARLNDPPLSTIRPPGEQVGYQAMRLLHQLMRGQSPPPEAIEVPTNLLIVRQSTSRSITPSGQIQEAVRLIEEEACRGLTVSDLVEAIRIPRSTFEHRFTEQVGRSPGQEIHRVRLDAAKRLLSETELSVTRIATMVGFTRSSIFGEFFKRKTGVTPTSFRRARRA